jgi:hypothetical protein
MRPAPALAAIGTAIIFCGIAAAQDVVKPTAKSKPATGQPLTAPAQPAQPAIVLSPQITVPPAPPPPITVQPATPAITVNPPAPASDPTKWVSLIISVASAAVAVISMLIARRNQTIGLRKDAAAIVRDLKAKEANAVIQAFENNVARPIGTVLDHIERLTNELLKLAPVATVQVAGAKKSAAQIAAEQARYTAEVAAEEAKYAAQLSLDRGNMLRLCREADGSLAPERPRSPFAATFGRMSLDVTLYLAGSEVLRGGDAAGVLATTLDAVAQIKVELRALLESERGEQIRLTIGDITDDPYYPEIVRYLGPQITTRLPNRAPRPAP